VALFEKGQAKVGGRTRGVKNRLSQAFLKALADDFEQHGAEAIKICRVEKPNEYLRVIAHLMPKELEIAIGPLEQISDDELDKLIEHTRQQVIEGSVVRDANGGEEPPSDRRPAALLQAVSETTRIP
jgi:hypothetical protein